MRQIMLSFGAQAPPSRRLAVPDLMAGSSAVSAGQSSFQDVFRSEITRFDSPGTNLQFEPHNPQFEARSSQPYQSPVVESKPVVESEQKAEEPVMVENRGNEQVSQRQPEMPQQMDKAAVQAAAAAAQAPAPKTEMPHKPDEAVLLRAVAAKAEAPKKGADLAAQVLAMMTDNSQGAALHRTGRETAKKTDQVDQQTADKATAAVVKKTERKLDSSRQVTAEQVAASLGKQKPVEGEAGKTRMAAADNAPAITTHSDISLAGYKAVQKKEGQSKEDGQAKEKASLSGEKAQLADLKHSETKPQAQAADQRISFQQVADKLAEAASVRKPVVKDGADNPVKSGETTAVKDVTAVKQTAETLFQPGATGLEKSMPVARATETFGPARLAEARDLTPMMQIVRSIETLIKDGQTSMRLQLYPENMGKIELRLVSNSDGVSVVIIPDQSATGKLLESQLYDLRNALFSAGINLTDLNVGQHDRSNSQESGKQNRARGASLADLEAIPDIEAERQMVLESSAHDYRI